MNDCLFCKIINKEIPSTFLFENDDVVAFLDINPTQPGHTLIVPKTHSANLNDIAPADLQSLIAIIPKVAKAVVKAVEAEGYNLVSNVEKSAGQLIMHTHMHIIPRKENDGVPKWPHASYENTEQMEDIAGKIRQLLT